MARRQTTRKGTAKAKGKKSPKKKNRKRKRESEKEKEKGKGKKEKKKEKRKGKGKGKEKRKREKEKRKGKREKRKREKEKRKGKEKRKREKEKRKGKEKRKREKEKRKGKEKRKRETTQGGFEPSIFEVTRLGHETAVDRCAIESVMNGGIRVEYGHETPIFEEKAQKHQNCTIVQISPEGPETASNEHASHSEALTHQPQPSPNTLKRKKGHFQD